jgi:hypothetical protein
MSRHSPKEIERCKRVASKMNVETGEAKAHSLHRLVMPLAQRQQLALDHIKRLKKDYPHYEVIAVCLECAKVNLDPHRAGARPVLGKWPPVKVPADWECESCQSKQLVAA